MAIPILTVNDGGDILPTEPYEIEIDNNANRDFEQPTFTDATGALRGLQTPIITSPAKPDYMPQVFETPAENLGSPYGTLEKVSHPVGTTATTNMNQALPPAPVTNLSQGSGNQYETPQGELPSGFTMDISGLSASGVVMVVLFAIIAVYVFKGV
jgi:hypothetical protein